MQQQNLGRSIIVAASILGACIVLAPLFFASGSDDAISPFARWSIDYQFSRQIGQALTDNMEIMGHRTDLRNADVNIRNLSVTNGGYTINILYEVVNSHIDLFGHGVLSKQADGSYKGQCQVLGEGLSVSESPIVNIVIRA